MGSKSFFNVFIIFLIENASMVYLKENSRALPTGVIIGTGKQPKVKIAPDLELVDLLYRGRKNDNVERIEVSVISDFFVLYMSADSSFVYLMMDLLWVCMCVFFGLFSLIFCFLTPIFCFELSTFYMYP